MEWGYTVAGLVVGFVVGLTGVGGGSLMTPILLWFGISPATAVGTDLLYASITKMGGVWVHHKQRHIDWHITGWLTVGSVPASLVTLFILKNLPSAHHADSIIRATLGFALLLTAVAIVFKPALLKLITRNRDASENRPLPKLATIGVGVLLGSVVTISSIGAGALGTLVLFALFPFLPTTRLIGTEIAHAVPLTLVAGLGHASMGNLNVDLLLNLLMGSLPGIWLGSHMTRRISDSWLRPSLAVMMAYGGLKLVM